jgi:hypothetical protein
VANGDELYSVTAVYFKDDIHGEIKMDESESLGLQFFSLDDLPLGLTESYLCFIKHYIKEYVL